MQAPEAAKPRLLPALSDYGRRAAGATVQGISALTRRPLLVVGALAVVAVADDARLRAHGAPQRLAALPGRRPDLAADDRLAARRRRARADVHRLRLAARGRTDHAARGPELRHRDAARDRAQRARARSARALGDLRPRCSDRRTGVRPPGRRRVGRAALRRDPALARRLPRALRRAVPARGARPDGPRRLPVDGLLLVGALLFMRALETRATLDSIAARHRGRLRDRGEAVERALRRRPGRRRCWRGPYGRCCRSASRCCRRC